MAVHRYEIETAVRHINTKLQYAGLPCIQLRSGYGKLGIDEGDNRNVTGLMTRADLKRWLDGFESGLDYVCKEHVS